MITEGVVDIDGIPVPQNDKDSRPVWDVRGMTAEQGRSLIASQGFVVNMTKEGIAEPTGRHHRRCHKVWRRYRAFCTGKT